MEEIKIGEYTRINGKIGIIKDIILNGNLYEDSGIYLENEKIVMGKEEIHKLKSSKNITELLEVGDFVNGQLVVQVCSKTGYVFTEPTYYDEIKGEEFHFCYKTGEIKDVVTKEQFNLEKYDVE